MKPDTFPFEIMILILIQFGNLQICFTYCKIIILLHSLSSVKIMAVEKWYAKYVNISEFSYAPEIFRKHLHINCCSVFLCISILLIRCQLTFYGLNFNKYNTCMSPDIYEWSTFDILPYVFNDSTWIRRNIKNKTVLRSLFFEMCFIPQSVFILFDLCNHMFFIWHHIVIHIDIIGSDSPLSMFGIMHIVLLSPGNYR